MIWLWRPVRRSLGSTLLEFDTTSNYKRMRGTMPSLGLLEIRPLYLECRTSGSTCAELVFTT